MRRRNFLVLGITALLCPRLSHAQKSTPVIGLLWNDSVKPSPYVATFLAAMGEKGYAAGRNFRIEDRVALEGYGSMAENAAALAHANVDLILTYGATAAHAAAKATKAIPIVAIIGRDPVTEGLAVSFSRPGKNLTGVATLSAGLTAKRFQLLRELVPNASRVGVLLAPNVGNPTTVRESESLAERLGFRVYFAEASGPGEIEARIAELANSRIEAMFVSASTMLASRSATIVEAVAKHRIPAVYGVERYADTGGLVTYYPSIRKAFIRAVPYVDRILKGARAAELPIEQTTDLELVVNLKTAKALGIRIPRPILARADKVIE